MSLIKLENISKYYKSGDGVSVGMQKVSLDFNIGEFVAVTGESGSGKSTLLNVISGLDTYEDGELFIQNEETSHFLVKDWENYRSKYIGFIFQNYNIIDSFTVYENVLLALEIQNYPRKLRKKRALELIDKVGLTSHKNHRAAKLSGGQKQRAVIARALAKDTPIIVADEPTGNLDSESSKQVIELLKELSEDKLIIIVTHDYDQVKDIATRHIKMHDGEVVEDKKLKNVATMTLEKEPDPAKMTMDTIARFALRNLLSRPRLLIFFIALQVMIVLVFTMTYTNAMNAARSEIFSFQIGNTEGEYFGFYGKNISDNRMYVIRKDGQLLTNNDYNYIRNLSGNHYVYEGVFELDQYDTLSIQYIDKNQQMMYLSGRYEFDTTYHIAKRPQFIIEGDVNLNNLAPNQVIVSNAFQVEVGDKLNTFTYLRATDLYATEHIGDYAYRLISEPTNINLDVVEYRINLTDGGSHTLSYWGYEIDLKNYFSSDVLLEIESVDAYVKYYKEIQNTYEIAGKYDDSNRSVIYFPHNHLNVVKDDSVALVTASSSISANRLFNQLKDSSDYRVIYPENEKDALSNLFAPLNFLFSLFFYAFIFFFALFLYFILYAVMKNVMSSRRKDFAIFRSIGTNESKLGMLVIFEQLFMMIISFIISLIVLNLLSRNFSNFNFILETLLPIDYVVLFLTFTYLSIWLARRFNKKTFKISVIENLTESREDTL